MSAASASGFELMMPQTPHIPAPTFPPVKCPHSRGNAAGTAMFQNRAQPSVVAIHIRKFTELSSAWNGRGDDDQTLHDQIPCFLWKHVLEIEPHLEKSLTREATATADAWVLQDDVILVQPADDGVVSASHRVPVARIRVRAHPIHNDRHSPAQPFCDRPEIRPVKHFRVEAELLSTFHQVRSGRSLRELVRQAFAICFSGICLPK